MLRTTTPGLSVYHHSSHHHHPRGLDWCRTYRFFPMILPRVTGGENKSRADSFCWQKPPGLPGSRVHGCLPRLARLPSDSPDALRFACHGCLPRLPAPLGLPSGSPRARLPRWLRHGDSVTATLPRLSATVAPPRRLRHGGSATAPSGFPRALLGLPSGLPSGSPRVPTRARLRTGEPSLAP